MALSEALKGQHLGILLTDYDTPTCGTRLINRWKECPGNTVSNGSLYYGGVPPNSVINDKLEGLTIDVLEIASKRWGFTYTAYSLALKPQNQSTTQWLSQHGRAYDFVAGLWTDTLARRKLGFVFPFDHFDLSPRLVVSLAREEPTFWDQMLGFTRPFTPALWGTIVGCSIVSASIIWLFEGSKVWREHGEASELKWKHGYKAILKSWYLAGALFSGGGTFVPVTTFGRATALSWSFAVMILVASCMQDSPLNVGY